MTKTDEESPDSVEIPDGALDERHPWSHRGRDVVEIWERTLVQPFLNDYRAATEYVAWRAGLTLEEALNWLQLSQLATIQRNVLHLVDAYNRVVESNIKARDQYRSQWEEGEEARRLAAEYMEQALEEMRRFRDEDWRG